MFENKFSFIKSIKNLTDIEDKINIIIETSEPKIKPKIEGKKRIISILNAIKYDLLDYYLNPNTIFEMHKTFGRDKGDNILKKYSKKDSCPIDEVINQIDMLRNTNQLPPEETIAERIKLRRHIYIYIYIYIKMRIRRKIYKSKNRKWTKNGYPR